MYLAHKCTSKRCYLSSGMRFLEPFEKLFISSNSIYCRDHKDTVRYVDIGETRSGRGEREERAKNARLGRRQDQRRKESSNSLDPLSRANINELKRVLSRPCHSGGRQNHPVDYEIMLLQKIKSGRRREEKRQSRRGTRGWRKEDRGGEARRNRKGKIRHDVSTSRNDHQVYRKRTVTRVKRGIDI